MKSSNVIRCNACGGYVGETLMNGIWNGRLPCEYTGKADNRRPIVIATCRECGTKMEFIKGGASDS